MSGIEEGRLDKLMSEACLLLYFGKLEHFESFFFELGLIKLKDSECILYSNNFN